MDYENLFSNMELFLKMNEVKRKIFLPEDGRPENNAEHSYSIAILLMFFLPYFPNLNHLECFKLALLHDTPEIFAGDTPLFETELLQTKKEREMRAIEMILAELPDISREEWKFLYEQYENKSTPESRFIYQLDKIQPMYVWILEKWNIWRSEYPWVTYEMIEQEKREKITDEFWLLPLLDFLLEKVKKEIIF